MKKAKRLAVLLTLMMTTMAFVGCGGKTGGSANSFKDSEPNGKTESAQASGDEILVDFWSAPEQYNYDIWLKYAQQFNDAGVEVNGNKVRVEVQQMPAQPSSEAGIQNAIATNSVPAISENINRSFAGTLANSEAIYDLSQEDWFKSAAQERQIEDVLKGWAINDAQYVLPLYVNPIGMVYNSKALQELGVSKVPGTMDEFNDLLARYSDKRDALSSGGVTHFMYRHELTRPDSWWERWFDFEAQYNAFSQGKGFVEDHKLVLDQAAVKKVFDLYGSMGDSLLTGEIPQLWQQDTIPVVAGIALPWDIQPNKAAGKTYGLEGDYIFGPMLVENSGDTPYTFADSKGLVLYKNKNITDDQHKGAIAFLEFVFVGQGKDTFDIDWLDVTSMLPVRGDLETNEALASYFAENPEIKEVSTFVANAIPCMSNEKMAEILTVLAETGLTPYITGESVNVGINKTPDSTSYVEKALAAMKVEGNLE